MAPTSSLGKRTRSAFKIHEESAAPRITENTAFVVDPLTKENPFVGSRKKRKPVRIAEDDDNDLDELSADQRSPARRKRAKTSPKSTDCSKDRAVLSPKGINGHFNVSKLNRVEPKNCLPVEAIPLTPRHRDALVKGKPSTPKRRVTVPGTLPTPQTPKTPRTPGALSNVYNDARLLFSGAAPSKQLVGRETEKLELRSFISENIERRSSGCIYVSGPPGTGKSAITADVCSAFESHDSAKVTYINCMSVKSSSGICGTLLQAFSALENSQELSACERLKDLLSGGQLSHVIVLDEIDYLLDIDVELLYDLFEWSLDPSTNLILVGIANALDFTDRFLPRLKSRGLKPVLLPFLPYSASEIASIITNNLKSLVCAGSDDKDFVPLIHPTAIQFISKKVAAQTGDLRKALDICRQAINTIEAETRQKAIDSETAAVENSPQGPVFTHTRSPSKTPLMENMNLSSPTTPSTKQPKEVSATPRKSGVSAFLNELTPKSAPRATIAHAAKVTAAAFGAVNSANRLRSLNIQQKAVLCALAALERSLRASARSSEDQISHTPAKSGLAPRTPSKPVKSFVGVTAPSLKQLYSCYSSACRRDETLHPLSGSEFGDVVGSLESLSLVAAEYTLGGSSLASTAASPSSASKHQNGGADTPSKRGRKPSAFGRGGQRAKGGEGKMVVSRVAEREIREAVSQGLGSGILKGILEGEI